MIYLNVLYVMYIPSYDKVLLTWTDNLCSAIRQRPTPEFLVARKYTHTPFSTPYQDFHLTHCNVDPTGEYEFL